jgi:hypothetical protein
MFPLANLGRCDINSEIIFANSSGHTFSAIWLEADNDISIFCPSGQDLPKRLC